MSVEKMEQYKEYKKHRKEILRKQKQKERLSAILGITCCVVILGAIGFFVYQDLKPDNTKKYETLVDWDKYLPKDILGDDEEATEADGKENADSTDAAADGKDADTEGETSDAGADASK